MTACDIAITAAVGTLLIGFALPKVCTLIQIAMITTLIMHGGVKWVPAIVLLLLNPTDFKAGGMALQYEKFEGVTVYVFGFPMTASYAIVGATLGRGFLNLLGSRFAKTAFSTAWLVPLTIAASICMYLSLLALGARLPGWSASARASLLLFSLWYATSLATNWAVASAVILRRLGPLASVLVALGFFTPIGAPITAFYLPVAVGWATWLTFGKLPAQYRLWRPLGAGAMLLCWLVPIAGLRISASVAEESYQKLGQQTFTLMTLTTLVVSTLLVLLQRRVASSRSTAFATTAAIVIFVAYVTIPFAVSAIATDVDYGVKTNAGSLADRIVYKLFVERAAIWRGNIELLKEPPYVFPKPGRTGSIITNAQKRIAFRHSAHNLVLDILRLQGWLAGGISLIVVYVCFAACLRAYLMTSDPAVMISATTFIVGVIVNGFAVGHFLETGVELLMLISAGLCLGWLVIAKASRAVPPQRLVSGRAVDE